MGELSIIHLSLLIFLGGGGGGGFDRNEFLLAGMSAV